MSDPKILVVTPTRARPENVRRLRQSLIERSENSNSFDHIMCIDRDDPKLADYLVDGQTPGYYYLVRESRRLGPWLNYMAEITHRDDYDIIAFIGDDVVARTYGWDKAVREAMQTSKIVYTDDGWQGEGLPTAVFMSTEMVKKAGYMVYPELTHLYIDNHWKAWGEAINSITYVPEVLLEHMHPFAGKAETDKVYEDANADHMYDKDRAAFEKFTREELPELVKRLG